MIITIIAWIIIFPSQRLLNILNLNIQSQLVFYGVWTGVLYPNTIPRDSFWQHVSGYLWILLFLVLEKKCLEWLAEEETRQGLKSYEETIGGRNYQKNYELLTKEVQRRQDIEDKRAGRNKNNGKKIGFQGIDDEGKIDPKEKLKQKLDETLNKRPSKKEEIKTAPPLKSAMKRVSKQISGKEELKSPSKQLEVTVKSQDALANGQDTDDDFNNLFAKSDDPKKIETRKLLLFQYKIKFMRGAKTLIEEFITFGLLIWALYKDNILSLIYYWMSVRMLIEHVDIKYRMKVTFYVSVFALAQYFLCLSNWNKHNSPLELPVPFNTDHELSYINPPLPLPWSDKIEISASWKKYLLIDKNSDILHSIMFETIVICLSAIYIYSFSPYLYNIDKKESRELLKVKSDLGKNKMFLVFVQRSSIFATVYKGLKDILYNTCHIFLILILLVLTSQNSGVLAIGYLLFALFYLYKSLDLLMDKYWDYPEAIHTFKYYIIWDWALWIIYQLPFFYLHFKENYFNSLQAFIGLESFWLEYTLSWNERAMIWMLLKFLAIWFIHLQEILFGSDDYTLHKQHISKRSVARNKALCMAYYYNNKKIHKERDIKVIKRNMQLKLDLVQEQLSGTKFGQIAGRNTLGKHELLAIPNIDDHSDISLHSDDEASIPYLRKRMSSYDAKLVQKEEKELQKKRLELEKTEKDLELFQQFTEEEQNELDKLDLLTKIYLFLRRTITNPIISCDDADLKDAQDEFAAGALHWQNRIEKIGKRKERTPQQEIELKDLTEKKTIIFNIFSTFIYCFISYTSSVAYMFMFLNCMWTGNLISMFYPLSVLLYALLEDPRPKNKYWSIVLIYAEWVILFKFLIQQNALTVLTPGSLFVEIVDKFKFGFRVFDKKEYAHGIFSFIIWDILVALSVLLHQHCLVFIGLWKKREWDFETLDEAKRRIHLQIRKKKYEQELLHFKRSEEIRRLNDLVSDDEEELKMELSDLNKIKSEILSPEKEQEKEVALEDDDLKEDMRREKSAKLPLLSAKFESARDLSPFARTNERKISLMEIENNFLANNYFTEGYDHLHKAKYEEGYFIHDYSENTETAERFSWDARIRIQSGEEYSQYDKDVHCMSENGLKYYEGFDEEAVIALEADMIRAHNIENRDPNELRKAISFQQLVLQNEFIFRIFPKSKSEKPGIDLYNLGVVIQFLIVSYILFFFSQMTGEKEELSETFKFKRFRTEMIFFMFIQIMLVLLDRFFYIRNTFDKEKEVVPSETSDDDEDEEDEEKKESIFTTLLHSDNRHNFIKLIVYVLLVFLVHSISIWYLPMTGNYKISEQIFCDPNSPCNDLSDNMFLWGFYALYMAYFCVTALQFRYGLPEIRKGHFMYERVSRFNTLAFNIFFYIPFLFEVKTFIDWTFTKTSLKIWDWFTFETIYSEFYGAKIGAEKDKKHNIGDPQGWVNKVMYGCTGLLACLGLILAPLIIFSSLNPIAELNLVKGAGIELNIELEEGKSLYNIFSTTVANEIRNLTEEEFSLLSFRKYKELRVSDHSLYQRVEMLPYSDKIWSLSPPAIRKMRDHFELAMKTNYSEAAISLEYSFNRQYPPGSNKLQRFLKKKIMDIENYHDIFKSFYEALNSKDCKPVFIKLDRFYPSVVHLTNEIEPEVINIKFKTLNLKIFWTPDPLIGHNQVKYWTLYIEDDLDIARRKKKFLEEEDGNKLSINIKPKDSLLEDEDYIYENKETMGIADQTNDPEKSEKPNFGAHTEGNNDNLMYNKPTTYQERSDLAARLIRDKKAAVVPPPSTDTFSITSPTKPIANKTITEPILSNPGNKTVLEKVLNSSNQEPNKESALVLLEEDTSDDIEVPKVLSEDAKMHIDTPLTTLPPPPDDLKLDIDDEEQDNQTSTQRNLAESDQQNKIPFTSEMKNNALEIDPTPDIETDIKISLSPASDQNSKDFIEYQKMHNTTEREGDDKMGEMNENKHEQIKDEHESAKQMGVVLYTFSDKVTPGLLQYSVITFYVSVVFVAGKLLRGYLWGSTEKIYLSNLPYPDELLVIWEGVVISRMQKDIYREEELYLVLIDLIRSPEILKIITHPQLKPKED